MGSEQAHYSVARAIKVMGWGTDGFVPVPHDDQLRLRVDALEERLQIADSKGRRVIAVVANACCTSTGTFDLLEGIADFCHRHGIWFHVDGAHGAAACLSEKYRHLVRGIERADSVVSDAHKLLLMPALCTAVLFRSGPDAYTAFAEKASYLFEHAPEEERYNLGHRTIECTKRMLALKLYAVLACRGPERLGAYVTERFDLARRFAAIIGATPDFELGAQPESNIVCLRYLGGKGDCLDEVQNRTRQRLIERGTTYLVRVQLPQGVFLRTALMNPATQERHLTRLLDEIRAVNAC